MTECKYDPSMDDQDAIEAFFDCVEAVCSDAETRQQIVPALRRRLEHPPTAVFNAVLGRQLSDAQVRHLLFTPSPSDLALYPALLAGDHACPTDLTSSAANKAQLAVLSHMYLVHGRTWCRMRPFIEAGGLRPLVALLTHPNHILASQALTLLLAVTLPEMYDWHNPPYSSTTDPGTSSSDQQQVAALGETADSDQQSSAAAVDNQEQQQPGSAQWPPGSKPNTTHNTTVPSSSSSSAVTCHPSQGPDGVLWLELAQLAQGPLLPSLLSLRPDRWPGSGCQALQLLAFYLGWLRAWWSKGGILQLSAALLSGLTAWSNRGSASREERQLAAQLVTDFGRAGAAPTAPTAAAAAAGGGGGGGGGFAAGATAGGGCAGNACQKDFAAGAAAAADGGDVCVGFEPAVEWKVVADRTQINTSPGSEAARLEAAGNDAFKARDWATAIQLYSAALDVPVPTEALLDEAPRRAVYHTNRAAAYLERIWELQAAAAADPQAGSGSSGSSGSSSSWREVGGLLDGLTLDGLSPDSLSRQLTAAVMDCRAALNLAPAHAKAHYRLATALCAQGNLSQALAAAAAAQQHAASAADKAAAARLAAAITQQQKQGARSTGGSSGAAAAVVPKRPEPAAAAAGYGSLGNGGSSKAPVVPQPVGNAAAANPLDELLEQFAAAMSRPVGQGTAAKSKQSTKSANLGIILPGTAAAAATAAEEDEWAASDEGISSLRLPGQDTQQQQQHRHLQQQQGRQGRKGQVLSCQQQPAGTNKKVLVEVLASSESQQRVVEPVHAATGSDSSDGDGSSSIVTLAGPSRQAAATAPQAADAAAGEAAAPWPCVEGQLAMQGVAVAAAAAAGQPAVVQEQQQQADAEVVVSAAIHASEAVRHCHKTASGAADAAVSLPDSCQALNDQKELLQQQQEQQEQQQPGEQQQQQLVWQDLEELLEVMD